MIAKVLFTLLLLASLGQIISQDTERLTSEEFYSGIKDERFDVIIDVRTIEEWDRGHIHGATFMEDLNRYGTSSEISTPADLEGCEDCTIAVYCNSGARASQAARILADAGFKTPIYNGLGVMQWQAAGYPLVNTPSVVAPCQDGLSCSGESLTEPPTESPTEPPTESPTWPDDFPCFSGQSTVEVKERGKVPLLEVQVGDRVRVKGNRYEEVYFFGHRDESVSATYLQFLPSLLEASRDHMIFIQNRGAIPASKVQVGDLLVNGDAVKAIREVKRVGAFAPFTPSGTIVVNDVLSSTYISFQDSSVVKIGFIETNITYQWMAHTFMAPYRIWAKYCGGRFIEGVDTWPSFGYKYYTWLLRQNPLFMGIIFIPIISVCFIFASLENICSHFFSFAVCAITFIILRKSSKRP